MKQDEVNELLKEAIESEGFLNLDQNDIEKLKNDVDSVDAIKVSGKNEQVGDLLSEAISTLEETNREKIIRKLLFAIRFPAENEFLMENMSKVHEVLDMLDEDVECVWGISTNDKLKDDNLELIVSVGLVNMK